EGVTVLLTTHDLADVEALADRVAIVVRGRVAAEGTPASLGAPSAEAPLLIRFGRPLPAQEAAAFVEAFPGATVIDTGERALVPPVNGAGLDANRLAAVTAWSAERALPIVETRT